MSGKPHKMQDTQARAVSQQSKPQSDPPAVVADRWAVMLRDLAGERPLPLQAIPGRRYSGDGAADDDDDADDEQAEGACPAPSGGAQSVCANRPGGNPLVPYAQIKSPL